MFCILGETVSAVSERGVVVVVADSGIEADAGDDLLRIESVGFGEGVELVEIGHSHGEIGVGEQFDGFGLGRSHGESFDILVLSTFSEKGCKALGFVFESGAAGNSDDDPGRVEVVIERSSFSQELWGEYDVMDVILLTESLGESDGDGGFDNNGRFWADGLELFCHGFHRTGVEVMSLGIVIGRCSNDDVIRTFRIVYVERCVKIQLALGKKQLYFPVRDWRFPAVDQFYFLGNHIDCRYLEFPRYQYGEGKADVSCAYDGDFHNPRLTA